MIIAGWVNENGIGWALSWCMNDITDHEIPVMSQLIWDNKKSGSIIHHLVFVPGSSRFSRS